MTTAGLVYRLELDGGKWYVGKTIDHPSLCERERAHRSGQGAGWTRLHRPTARGPEVFPTPPGLSSGTHEHAITLETMRAFGMDNVRGGPYCSPVLPDSQVEALRHSLRSAGDACFACGGEDHFAHNCLRRGEGGAPGAAPASTSLAVGTRSPGDRTGVAPGTNSEIGKTENMDYDALLERLRRDMACEVSQIVRDQVRDAVRREVQEAASESQRQAQSQGDVAMDNDTHTALRSLDAWLRRGALWTAQGQWDAGFTRHLVGSWRAGERLSDSAQCSARKCWYKARVSGAYLAAPGDWAAHDYDPDWFPSDSGTRENPSGALK